MPIFGSLHPSKRLQVIDKRLGLAISLTEPSECRAGRQVCVFCAIWNEKSH
ncbi:hypothetical protein VDGL01_07739 [Verticillium dahliae]